MIQKVGAGRRVGLWILLLFLLTPLRATFVVLAPFVVWLVCILYPGIMNFSIKNLIMTILFIISVILSLINGYSSISNLLLSIWITFPILLLLFSHFMRKSKYSSNDFILISTRILIIINILGLLFHFYTKGDPDAMGFGYGRHFASQNGLAIIDAIFLIYYFNKYWSYRLRKYLYLCIFFFVCFLFCECGLALLCLLISFLVTVNLRFKVKYVLYSFIGLLFILTVIFYCSVDVDYYVGSLTKVSNSELWEYDFRKIGVFINYFEIAKEKSFVIPFGIGPGSYNSRIAFMLNTDANNLFTDLFGHSMPYYHAKYVQPLWDKGVLDALSFNDGSRNKPFSSLLSLLSEFGLLMLFLVLKEFYNRIKDFRKCSIGSLEFPYLFSTVFIFFMLMIDQWLETSEMCFIILFWFVVKQDVYNKNEHSKNQRFVIS